jgi:hypothetical protein
MSLYIDVKFLNQIGPRLQMFKRKADYLYNCRCPICGDSQTKKSKTRGYFYRRNNDLFYKCHNCDASQHFGTFLKNFDNNIYREYVLERYAAGENGRPHANPEPDLKVQFKEPVFQPPPATTLLDTLLERVDTLPADSEVRQFLTQRQIPEAQLHRLYFIDDIKKIETFHSRYVNTIQTHEPRLVIPFYNAAGQLTGLSCRALRGETLRYITVRINETDPLIFGLECLDRTQPMFVCEGPLDSLFVDNCIAVGGTGFGKLESLGLDKNNLTVIIDNQPRNSEVCKVYDKLITQSYRVLIWPDYTSAKDLNELVIQGIQDRLKFWIDQHSFRNLTAQLKFNTWRKI